MIESLREHIPNLLHTRDGTRVAMNCVWSGSVKDRKIMVKSMKTHVLKVCKEEHGHFFLLSIFDSVDDTILVQKAILDVSWHCFTFSSLYSKQYICLNEEDDLILFKRQLKSMKQINSLVQIALYMQINIITRRIINSWEP